MTDDIVYFKAFIASLRQRPQKDMARLIGISPQYLCDLIKMRRDWNPDILSRTLRELPGISRNAHPAINRHCARLVGWRI